MVSLLRSMTSDISVATGSGITLRFLSRTNISLVGMQVEVQGVATKGAMHHQLYVTEFAKRDHFETM